MPSLVTEPGFADPATALAHFERRLGVETDCSDVHESLKGDLDFVLVDVRGPKLYARGHVPRRRQHPAPDHDGGAHGAVPARTPPSWSIAPVRTATAPTRPRSGSPAWVTA